MRRRAARGSDSLGPAYTFTLLAKAVGWLGVSRRYRARSPSLMSRRYAICRAASVGRLNMLIKRKGIQCIRVASQGLPINQKDANGERELARKTDVALSA